MTASPKSKSVIDTSSSNAEDSDDEPLQKKKTPPTVIMDSSLFLCFIVVNLLTRTNYKCSQLQNTQYFNYQYSQENDIRKFVEKLLKGADLEVVTMKSVFQQVYEKYPEFDLTDKKAFIKETVKKVRVGYTTVNCLNATLSSLLLFVSGRLSPEFFHSHRLSSQRIDCV